MMSFYKIIRIPDHPLRADKSAMCTINRHLRVSGFICQSASLRPYVLFVAADGADWLKDAGAAFRRTLFCQRRRQVLAAALHLRQQLDHFSTQGRCIFNGKLAVRVAQDAVGWSLHKIVFEDQAVRRHLNAMVTIGYGSIVYTELQLDRDRTTIGQLDDVIWLAHQWIGA